MRTVAGPSSVVQCALSDGPVVRRWPICAPRWTISANIAVCGRGSTWYRGKDGLPELFPWIPERHRELLRRPEVADFDVRTA